MRRNLTFRENNPLENEVDNFFKESCPPRCLSLFVSIAVKELIETYHLEKASSEDIVKFISFYAYIKEYQKKHPSNTISAEVLTSAAAPEINEGVSADDSSDNSLISKEDKDIMADVMASLFS